MNVKGLVTLNFKTISDLLLEKEKPGSTIIGLEEEVTLLKSKLENMPESVHIKYTNSDMLDDILKGNMKAIGFDYSSMNKNIKVPSKKNTEFQVVDHMSQHRARHVYPHHKGNKKSSWRYHHCGIYGHIRTFYYKLYGYYEYYSQPKSKGKKWKETQAKTV